MSQSPVQQPTQAAPEPTQTTASAQPMTQETVEAAVTEWLQEKVSAAGWRQTAEKMFETHADMLDNLAASMTRVEKMLASLAKAPDVESVLPSPSLPTTPNIPVLLHPPTPSTRTTVKPHQPPPFNGSRTSGRDFLNSCNAYYKLRSDDFRDDQYRIHWVLTFMNTDRAAKWTNRIYSAENDKPGVPYFRSWDAFVEEFRKEFFPLYPEQHAINQLEADSYWQQGRSLDTYIDDFRDLIRDTKISDQRVLVVKFRRGLKNSIQNEVATMTSGRPSDDDLEAWIAQARSVEQNQASNAAFKATLNAPRAFPQPRKPITTGTSITSHSTFVPTFSTFKSNNPTLSLPLPLPPLQHPKPKPPNLRVNPRGPGGLTTRPQPATLSQWT